MRQISNDGLVLVKKFEGIEDGDPTTVNLDPYLDPVGIWTIGWGHAIVDPKTSSFLRGHAMEGRAKALYPDGISTEQADVLLRADLLDAARDVISHVEVVTNENEFAALVSFEFNTGALGKSTLLKKLNASDRIGAANEFYKWNKGHTPAGQLVKLDGLVIRREAERKLFTTPVEATNGV